MRHPGTLDERELDERAEFQLGTDRLSLPDNSDLPVGPNLTETLCSVPQESCGLIEGVYVRQSDDEEVLSLDAARGQLELRHRTKPPSLHSRWD
jgi:hypothetical protein